MTTTRALVERPILLGPEQDQIGIVTVPKVPRGVAVLLMNAGLVHRVGPGRLNVEIARAVAPAGLFALRLDLAGFGDSGPSGEGLSFEAAAVRDLRRAMDWMREHYEVQRFVPVGLCSGADVALELAAASPDVAGAVLIDCFNYDTRLSFIRGYTQRALDPRSWKGFLGGGPSDLRARCVARVKGALTQDTEAAPPVEASMWRQPPTSEIAKLVERATSNRARLHLIYSGGPAYDNYLLNLRPIFRPHLRAGRADLVRFEEADHTFTMVYHRRQLVERVVACATRAL